MSLKKKIKNYIEDIYQYCHVEKYDFDFVGNPVYLITDSINDNKKFNYCYDKRYSFRYNMMNLRNIIIEDFSVIEVENCKYSKDIIMKKEWNECKCKCIYRPFCKRKEIWND